MSLRDVREEKPLAISRWSPGSNPGPGKQTKKPMALPSLDSDEWETMELPPGPSGRVNSPGSSKKK
jgi:hypothetical protein